MARIVKTAEQRKLEIIQTAGRLFSQNGYNKTSIDQIIQTMGVAKGTFYYYFRSKKEVLEAIVDNTLEQIVEQSEQIANNTSMDALTKMRLLLSGGHVGEENTAQIVEILHLPENRELHEISNVQTVLRLSPVLAKIVEQGNREKTFEVKHPLETIQILLTGSQFLLDGGLFAFSDQEISARRVASQIIIEKSLGAQPGSFSFLTQNLPQGAKK